MALRTALDCTALDCLALDGLALDCLALDCLVLDGLALDGLALDGLALHVSSSGARARQSGSRVGPYAMHLAEESMTARLRTIGDLSRLFAHVAGSRARSGYRRQPTGRWSASWTLGPTFTPFGRSVSSFKPPLVQA